MASPTRVAPKPEFVLGPGLGNVQRIRDLARKRGVEIPLATERFTLEASLRRIFASSYADRFGYMTLKGGSLMYFSEGVDPIDSRPTKDIDIELSGYEGTLDHLRTILAEALSGVPDPDDGVRFHVDALTANEVAENRAVPGGSISCPVQIGQSVYTFKVDAGFHPLDHREDTIVRDYVSLIPGRLPVFQVPCRPLEYALADKIQACDRHGMTNSRLRDYYDMTVFFTRNDIDLDLAAKAVLRTFALYRSERIPASVDDMPALSAEFAQNAAKRWDAIRQQGAWPIPMGTLDEVVAALRERIQPILDRANAPADAARP